MINTLKIDEIYELLDEVKKRVHDKYRAKNGSGKKTLHFTVQKVVSADNKS